MKNSRKTVHSPAVSGSPIVTQKQGRWVIVSYEEADEYNSGGSHVVHQSITCDAYDGFQGWNISENFALNS